MDDLPMDQVPLLADDKDAGYLSVSLVVVTILLLSVGLVVGGCYAAGLLVQIVMPPEGAEFTYDFPTSFALGAIAVPIFSLVVLVVLGLLLFLRWYECCCFRRGWQPGKWQTTKLDE